MLTECKNSKETENMEDRAAQGHRKQQIRTFKKKKKS